MLGKERPAEQLQDPDCMTAHLGCSWQQKRQDSSVVLMREVVVEQEQNILHAVGGRVSATVGGIQLAVLLEKHLQDK